MDSSRIIQIIMVLIIALAIILWSYRKLAWRVPVLGASTLDKTDKRIVWGLMLIYLVISGINLGLRTNFGMWHGDDPSDSLEIRFAGPTQISSVAYYYGLGSGSLNLTYYTSVGGTGNVPLTNNSALYKWTTVQLPDNPDVVGMKLMVSPPIELRHLALYDHAGHYLNNYTIIASDGSDVSGLMSQNPPSAVQNTSLSSMYFDEIYYGRTAWEYLHGISPYAWVHPPLGILIVGLGILLFGMNPFGWRIMPAVSGILMIPVIYLFAKKIFNDRKIAIVSTVLMMTDFMHFSVCRMASIDSSSTLFVLLELMFFYDYVRQRLAGNEANAFKALFFAGLFFGMGMSCKWDALFTIPLLLGLLIYAELIRRRPSVLVFIPALAKVALSMLIVPLAVYCLSYLPYFSHDPVSNFVKFIYNLQGYMVGYHTGLVGHATHPYASSWWGWPLLTKPLSVFFWQDNSTNIASSIVLMGNPAIWWVGIPAFFAGVGFAVYKRDFRGIYLTLAILTLYLPWTVIGRLSFNYYFYVVTPLWILMISYVLWQISQIWPKESNRFIVGYLAICVFLFILFYPAISGLAVSRDYVVHYLLWFSPAWNF